MSDDAMPSDLSAPAALKKIRELAADTGRIVVLNHAKKRMQDHGISRQQVDRCVQKGVLREGPALNSHGNWQATLYRMAAGEELTCIVAIDWPSKLLVITAFPGRK